MIRASWRVCVAVVSALVVGACSTQVAGSPVPVPNPTPTTPDKSLATAEKLLGDMSTIDPCGYVEARDLKQFGEVAGAPAQSLDNCLLNVTVTGGAKLDVLFGALEQLDSERELRGMAEGYRELRIVEEPGDVVQCARLILFTDLVTLSVSVDNLSTENVSPQELCRIADRTAEVVADTVLAGKVEHREFPAKSVGALDACAALRSSPGQVPGLTSPKKRAYPARHQCRWSRDGGSSAPRVRVTYAFGKPTPPDGADVVQEDIAGRPTVLVKSAAASVSFCAAETVHIEAGGGLRELVVATVSLPAGTSADQACAALRVVAAEAWASLPE